MDRQKVIRGSRVGHDIPTDERAKEIAARMDTLLKDAAERYLKVQVLANGVEMPGTYLDLGVGKNDLWKSSL